MSNPCPADIMDGLNMPLLNARKGMRLHLLHSLRLDFPRRKVRAIVGEVDLGKYASTTEDVIILPKSIV
jgi:hypothetical protein